MRSLPNEWKVLQQIRDHNPVDLRHALNDYNSKFIYGKMVERKIERPTSEINFTEKYGVMKREWQLIYTLQIKVIADVKYRNFQFKVVHNLLYTNDKLCRYKMVPSDKCYFCGMQKETPIHLLYDCHIVDIFWNEVLQRYHTIFERINITQKAVLLGLLNDKNVNKLANLILIVVKKYIYDVKVKEGVLCIEQLLKKLDAIEQNERIIAIGNDRLDMHEFIWRNFRV